MTMYCVLEAKKTQTKNMSGKGKEYSISIHHLITSRSLPTSTTLSKP